MSDRMVILPWNRPCEWADVVIPENASPEEVIKFAEDFNKMSGPHRIYVQDETNSKVEAVLRQMDFGAAIYTRKDFPQ